MENFINKSVDKIVFVVYNRDITIKRKNNMNNQQIKNEFLDEQRHYMDLGNDMYAASQMASIAVRNQHGLSKEQLINILGK